ncbi:MAG: hypothetical protein ACRDAM_18885 [Casimicrobium sp.]
MKTELAAWNGGDGIDLETWIGCSGSFSLAIGYATLFWPEFVEHRDHVLRKDFSVEAFDGFAAGPDATRASIEWVMNHVHLSDIHHHGCDDLSKDKLLVLGNVLKEIYETKLASKFPMRTFVVEFFVPEDQDELGQYQLSFWQQEFANS